MGDNPATALRWLKCRFCGGSLAQNSASTWCIACLRDQRREEGREQP